MTTPVHPHDVGLHPRVVRKRRHARHLAHWMLVVAVLTAVAGWAIYGNSFFLSLRRPADNRPAYAAILAYALLMISSVTLILGLWYLLLAQVNRIARIVEETEPAAGPDLKCPNCGWPCDAPDRFCRHCGKPLAAAVAAAPANPSV